MIGTSMATPHVSGAAALLIAAGVEGSDNIRSRLINTARDLGKRGKDNYYGYGLIDVYGALLNRKITKAEVFAFTKGENIYNLKSDIKNADDQGFFKLEKVESGKVFIAAWLDLNKNEVVDIGDYYGEKGPFNITDSINDLNIEMRYISDFTSKIKVQRGRSSN